MNSPDLLHKLGTVSYLMTRSDEYCQYPMACLQLWIEPAIRLDQICIFRDLNGQPIGYATWAFLAEDTEHRLLHDVDVVFHLSEWNEGDRLWVMDFVVTNGDVRHCISALHRALPQAARIKSLRRHSDGSVRRVTTWRN